MMAATAGELPASLVELLRDQARSSSSKISLDVLKDDASALGSEQSVAYLEKLTSLSLASVQALPASLSRNVENVAGSLSALCRRHANAFVLVHEATTQLGSTLSSIDEELEGSLPPRIDHLVDETDAFETSADEPLETRARVTRLAEAHRDQLGHLLELPGLVQACVKAQRVDEALQLGSYLSDVYAAALESRKNEAGQRSEGAKLLQSLLVEVWHSLDELQAKLSLAWSSPALKLPMAKRTLTQLRSLAELKASTGSTLPISSSHFCLAFLRARIALLQENTSMLAFKSDAEITTRGVDEEELEQASSAIRRFVDAWRESVVEMLAMAAALFPHEKGAGHLSPDLLIGAACHQLAAGLSTRVVRYITWLCRASAEPTARVRAAERLSELHRQLRYASVACARHGFDLSSSLRCLSPPGKDDQVQSFSDATLALFRAGSQSVADALRGEEVWSALQVDQLLADSSPADQEFPTALQAVPLLGRYVNAMIDVLAAAQIFMPADCTLAVLEQSSIHLQDASDVLTRMLDEQASSSVPAVVREQIEKALPLLVAASASPHHRSHLAAAERLLLSRVLALWSEQVVPWWLNALHRDTLGVDRLPHDQQARLDADADRHRVRVQEAEKTWERARSEIKEEIARKQREAGEKEQARVQAEKKAHAEAQAKAQAEAEQEAKAQVEHERQVEAEADARAAAEARIKADKEAKADADAAEKATPDAEAKVKADPEPKAKTDANAKRDAAAGQQEFDEGSEARGNGEAETNEDEILKSRAEAQRDSEATDKHGSKESLPPPVAKANDESPTTPDEHDTQASANDVDAGETTKTATAEAKLPSEAEQVEGEGETSETAAESSTATAVPPAKAGKKLTLAEKLKLKQEQRERERGRKAEDAS